MRIAISQPRYLPAINYIQRIILSDVFVLLDCVQHQPRAFEHRNRIKTSNGPVWLSIPLQRTDSRMIIKNIKVRDLKWKERHIKTIKAFYKRSPFYDEDLLEALYNFDYMHLTDIAEYMLKIIMNYLEIERPIIRSSSLGLKEVHDKKLAEIVKVLGGDTYISGPNGRNYININNFQGIHVLYHDFHYPTYDQLWGDFIPWLAFVDVLFNVGLREFKKIIGDNYELNKD